MSAIITVEFVIWNPGPSAGHFLLLAHVRLAACSLLLITVH